MIRSIASVVEINDFSSVLHYILINAAVFMCTFHKNVLVRVITIAMIFACYPAGMMMKMVIGRPP